MKKLYFLALFFAGCTLRAQNNSLTVKDFDEQKAIAEAKAKGIPEGDIKGYVNAVRARFVGQNHKHTEDEYYNKKVTLINMNTGKVIESIQTSLCQNSDLSWLNYSNWTGDISNSNMYALPYPVNIYTGTGFNGNGGTPIMLNTDPCMGTTIATDRHVLMSITIGPATNNIGLAFNNGYDPNCQNPNTGLFDLSMTPSNGVNSIRLGSAYQNYTGEKLRYAITVNSSNALFSYQYAVVINDGTHMPGEQAAFLLSMKDTNGNILTAAGNPSCVQYNVDATEASYDTSFIKTISTCTQSGVPWTYYRKWRTVKIDLSTYVGQTVYAEFETVDCIYSGHYCYAYISANCGSLGYNATSFCGTLGTAVMNAPSGFAAYQWYGPNNTVPISGATSQSYTATFASQGDVFSVDCITLQGCTTKLNVTVQPTILQVNYNGSASGVITSSNDTITVCQGDSLILSGVGANTYSWSGGISDGIVFYPVASQIYTVTSDCFDQIAVNVIMQPCGFGVTQIKTKQTPEIFPNPSFGSFAVNCSKNIDEIKITGILGNIIYSAKPNTQKVNMQIEEAGVYFVTITNGKEVTVRKVIVSR